MTDLLTRIRAYVAAISPHYCHMCESKVIINDTGCPHCKTMDYVHEEKGTEADALLREVAALEPPKPAGNAIDGLLATARPFLTEELLLKRGYTWSGSGWVAPAAKTAGAVPEAATRIDQLGLTGGVANVGDWAVEVRPGVVRIMSEERALGWNACRDAMLAAAPVPEADARYDDLPINDAVPAPTQILPGNLFLWNWRAMQQYGRACIALAAAVSAPEAERGKAVDVIAHDSGVDDERSMRQAFDKFTSKPEAERAKGDAVATFQSRVALWMAECFGAAIASDVRERGDRLLEEVLELLQSHGYDPARVATLRDYVFGRPVVEPAQEVGGVMVTLAAYCLATGIDMHTAGEAELARIWTKVETIRAKQASKRDLHSPLPHQPASEGATQVAEFTAADAGRIAAESFRRGVEFSASEAEGAGIEAVAWTIWDAKGVRFTVYNGDLAEALADLGLQVLPMFGGYEWHEPREDKWIPINRLPHTWERELGIAWRQRSVDTIPTPAADAGGVTDAMVERAAMAIAKKNQWYTKRLWNDLLKEDKASYRDEARAALTAALTPEVRHGE